MDAMDWAASAMVAARTRLEIATANLANVSTGGFRRTQARGFLTALGVAIARERSDAHGALRRTGRELDLAIVGDGAFRVRDAGGKVELSRDGAFERERDGRLRDDRGRVLLGTQLARGSSVQHGFLEESNVDGIAEMIDVLSAERSFESASKVVTAIDGTRQKAANDVARVR